MDKVKRMKMWKKALALLLAFAIIVPEGSVMSALGIGSIEARAEQVTTYTLTLDTNGGKINLLDDTWEKDETNGIYTHTYTAEDALTFYLGDNPKRNGCTFAGWIEVTNNYTDHQPGDPLISRNDVQIPAGTTESKTYKAIWNETEYSITYDLDGGVFPYDSTPAESYTYVGIQTTPITLVVPQKEGYSFTGWTYHFSYDSDITSDGTVTIDSAFFGENYRGQDLQFKANWAKQSYTLTLDAQGGTFIDGWQSGLPTDSVYVDSKATVGTDNSGNTTIGYCVETPTFCLPVPTKSNYEFEGWAVEQGNPIHNVTVYKGSTSNETYTAVWNPSTLTGTVSITALSDKFEYGETLTATVSDSNSVSYSPEYTYEWYREGTESAIQRSIGNTYVIGADDVGKSIYVRAILNDEANHQSGSITSRYTKKISKAPLHVALTTTTKSYDGTTAATVTATPKEDDLKSDADKNGTSDITRITVSVAEGSVYDDQYAGTDKIVTLPANALTVQGTNAAGYELLPVYGKKLTETTGTIGPATSGTLSTYDIGFPKYQGVTTGMLTAAVIQPHGELVFTPDENAQNRGYVTWNAQSGSFTINGFPPEGDGAISFAVASGEYSIGGSSDPEYSAGTGTVSIYEHGGNSLVTTTIRFEDNSVTKPYFSNGVKTQNFYIEPEDNIDVGIEDFSFSSSNKDVADVVDHKMITIKGIGSTVITAYFRGDYGYSPASASYTLTVTPTVIGENELTIPTAISSLTYEESDNDAVTQTGVAEGIGYTITGNTGSKAGDYVAIATPLAGYAWKVGATVGDTMINDYNKTHSMRIPWSIGKADRSAPSIQEGDVNPVTGTISGVTPAMEYSIGAYSNVYYPCSGSVISDIPAGSTVKIRYREDDNHNASPAQVITLESVQVYTVTFATSMGGTITQGRTVKVASGGTVATTDKPVIDVWGGYNTTPTWTYRNGDNLVTFVFGSTQVYDNITVLASFTPNEYSITYNGLTAAEIETTSNPAIYTVEDSNIVLKAPTREGSIFSGWTCEELEFDSPTKDITIYTASYATDLTFKANWESAQATAPTATPGSTSFTTQTLEVMLSTTEDGGTTYYTIDGSIPTRNSLACGETGNELFTIDETTTIKAYTVKLGKTDSEVATFTYNKSSGSIVTDRPITGITVTPDTETVEKGKTVSLTAALLPSNANETATITWSSGSDTIATVTGNGKTATITGVGKGQTVITASVTGKNGTFTAECTVNVVDEVINVTGITVDPTTAKVAPDKTVSVTAALLPDTQNENPEVTWTSGNTGVATVAASENNLTATITGVKEGTASITASVTSRSGQSYTATCEVTVEAEKIEVTGFTIAPLSACLEVGNTLTLIPSFKPVDQTENPQITWTSSDVTIASVSGGTVTGVAEGEVTITATVTTAKGETLTATCKISVVKDLIEATGITVTPEIAAVEEYDTITLTAAVLPADETECPVIMWSTSNPAVATVSQGGVVKGESAGAATITATIIGTNGTFSDTCAVTVNPYEEKYYDGGGEGNMPDADTGMTEFGGKFKANQSGAALNLYDYTSTTVVYFTGGAVNPDDVTIQGAANSYFSIMEEARVGSGATSVVVGVNQDKVKTMEDVTAASSSKAKKVTFVLKKEGMDGETTCSISLKVNKNPPAYKLTNKSAEIKNEDAAIFQTTEKNGLFADESLEFAYVNNKKEASPRTDVDITAEEGILTLDLSEYDSGKTSGFIRVMSENWVSDCAAYVKYTINRKITSKVQGLKLYHNGVSKTSITLNSAEAFKGGQTYTLNAEISGGAKAGGLVCTNESYFSEIIDVSIIEDEVTITLKKTSSNDKCVLEIAAVKGETTVAKTKFTVKTTNKNPNLKVKQKGKLDVVATDAYVYPSFSLTNYDAPFEVRLISDKLEYDAENGLVKKDPRNKTPFSKGAIECKYVAYVPGTDTVIAESTVVKTLVVQGKLAATATQVSLDDLEESNGYRTSTIQAVYTYSRYDSNGKSVKSFMTFAGEGVIICDLKTNKPITLALGDDAGTVRVMRGSNFKTGKKYNAVVYCQIAGNTNIKEVKATIYAYSKGPV